MQTAFTIIFAVIFSATLLGIFIFKKYKEDFLDKLEKKDKKALSLQFILGFSAWCVDLCYRLPFIRKFSSYEKKKQLLSALNTDISGEKSVYLHHIRLCSYIITIVLISSFLGIVYTASLSTHKDMNLTSITRPLTGEGTKDLSLMIDSETYSGTIDITVHEKEYSFDEAMDIFNKHRAQFDSYVLGDNTSFLYITSPLNLPSGWGDENISVTWNISNTDIIDYSGNIKTENLTTEGSPLEIIATLTLSDISADICYEVVVYPSDESPAASIKSYLEDYINSKDNVTAKTVLLPSEYNGQPILFYEEKEVYPSMDFYPCHYTSVCADYTFRK